MVLKQRTYDEWRSGVYGSADPIKAEYTAVNAQVYEDGSLGPRPGWKVWTNSGNLWSAGSATYLGMLWGRQSDDDPILWVVYDDVSIPQKQIEGSTYTGSTITWGTREAASELIDTAHLHPIGYPDTKTVQAWFDGHILAVIGGKASTTTSTGWNTFTIPSTADGYPAAMTVYRERAYYWGFSTNPGRIYYSDAADYSTVQATSYFDVSIDTSTNVGAVVGVWSIKNALLIARKDGRWFVLTGTSPDNGTLRELGLDRVPNFNTATAVDNQLYYLSATGKGVNVATPSFVETQDLEYLSPSAYPGSSFGRPDNAFQPLRAVGDEVTRALYLPARPSAGSQEILAVERVNDSWTLSRWDYNATATDVDFSGGRPNELWSVVTDGTDWKFHSRYHTLNRPASTADSLAVPLSSEPGGNGTMTITLGQITGDGNTAVRPVRLVLDIDYWKGGNYVNPSMTVDAKVLGTTGATSEDSATTLTIDTSSWANATKARRKVETGLEQLPFGQQLEITLKGDGWAVRRARVIYDEWEDRQ